MIFGSRTVALLLGMLACVGTGAAAMAQDDKRPAVAGLLPQLQTGLQEANSRMSAEEFTGCFVTALFIHKFAVQAKSPTTGQSMAELLEAFACATSELVNGTRYDVTGSMTVNGDTGDISSEVFRTQGAIAGARKTSDASWTVGRVLLGGQVIFRDEAYVPASRR